MVLTLDIYEIIRQLSIWRPIFHSEADFQFSLAWLIKKKYPECEICSDPKKLDFLFRAT